MHHSHLRANRLMVWLGSCVVAGSLLLSGAGLDPTEAQAQQGKGGGAPLEREILDLLTQIDQKLNQQQDLSGVTPNWDKVLPAAQRFVILSAFNNEAVLDKNTGLVWEKSSATASMFYGPAITGIDSCINKTIGGQKGWRLPSVAELASLIDPAVPSPGPKLPPGHPFLNVQSALYWSASGIHDSPFNAWLVDFNSGRVFANPKSNTGHTWCVRGGMNADHY